ncbi:MAG: hypothetical protein PHD37_03970 [Gallionellaceae bacterium]|nr:hypothetical protein [Gallionellaceae bacterium]
MMFAGRRLLLYLSAAGASCALQRNEQLSDVQYLPSEEEGWEAFNALLMAHPNIPVAIAVDSVDETYRGEILPRVWGQDRVEMTNRRLRQVVHQSPYRAALRQGRERKAATRGDRYLIMGLTNPEQVRPWLDIMHLRGTPLAGIWLLPALSANLVRRFKMEDPCLLLVSEQTGGLRLTYLEGGELRFSRLAPVDGSQHENPLEGYAEEIERTRQALVGQRLITRDEKIKVVLVDPLNTLNDLHGFLLEAAGFQCISINRGRLLEALKLPHALLAESADALYLSLLSHAPASANLMTAEQRAGSRAFWLRRGLVFGAVAWLTLSVAAALLLLGDAWRLDRQSDALQARMMSDHTRETSLLAPAGGASQIGQRLAAVEAWNAVRRRDQQPADLLDAAQSAADGIAGIQLTRLIWSNSDNSEAASLIIEGDLPAFSGDYRVAHASIATLARTLAEKLPKHHVEVSAWPLNAHSSEDLEGAIGGGQIAARFQLQVRAKP